MLQSLLNPQASSALIGLAARLAHGLGLHRWLEGYGLSQAELEQRRRVFWIIYIVDKSFCLRSGRPTAISEEDIGVDLPNELPTPDFVNLPPIFSEFSILRHKCTLAIIEAKIYSELYSAQSATRSANERLLSISRLDKELQEWKDLVPVEIRPEHEMRSQFQTIFPVMMLHFVYYHTLMTIHRVSVHHGSWTAADNVTKVDVESQANPAAPFHLNPRVFASYALCLSAARSVVIITSNFLNAGKASSSSMLWIALYYPLTACLTLFAHVIQSPLDPRSDGDLELLRSTVSFLFKHLNKEAMKSQLLFKLNIFNELVKIAQEHVAKSKIKAKSSAEKHHLEDDSNGPVKKQETAPDKQFAPGRPVPTMFSTNSNTSVDQPSYIEPPVEAMNFPDCFSFNYMPSGTGPFDAGLFQDPDFGQMEFTNFTEVPTTLDMPFVPPSLDNEDQTTHNFWT